jgi:hypothetical protein
VREEMGDELIEERYYHSTLPKFGGVQQICRLNVHRKRFNSTVAPSNRKYDLIRCDSDFNILFHNIEAFNTSWPNTKHIRDSISTFPSTLPPIKVTGSWLSMKPIWIQCPHSLPIPSHQGNRLMAEYEAHLGSLDVKFKCENERGRQKLDAMVKENDKLRQLVRGNCSKL